MTEPTLDERIKHTRMLFREREFQLASGDALAIVDELRAENGGLKRDIQCMLEAANRSLAAYRELGEKLFSRSISASFAASLAENEKLFNAYWKEKIP